MFWQDMKWLLSIFVQIFSMLLSKLLKLFHINLLRHRNTSSSEVFHKCHKFRVQTNEQSINLSYEETYGIANYDLIFGHFENSFSFFVSFLLSTKWNFKRKTFWISFVWHSDFIIFWNSDRTKNKCKKLFQILK